MVKRQKEKQYQSAREHRANQALRSGPASCSGSSSKSRRLPFDCCALTLTPYTDPVCTRDSCVIFDNNAILPYLLKHKVDPVTGHPTTSRDLIRLNMDKDEDGKWQCPVLNKPFTDRTKIVAVLQRGGGPNNDDANEANVYSYEAYHELNVKPKHCVDLISGVKFSRTTDVLVLQDPSDDVHESRRDISNFAHTSTLRSQEKARRDGSGGGGGGDGGSGGGSGSGDVRRSVTASRIMDKIEERRRKRAEDEEKEKAQRKKRRREDGDDGADEEPTKPKIFTDELTSVKYTTGKASGSFTSTIMEVSHGEDAREATSEELLQSQCDALRKLKKKGFVRLTLADDRGVIDLEIHCDMVPRTAMNFLGLVEKGAYNGSAFHRSIPNFMLQGGKPPTSKGEGTSLWGEPFPDEFDDRLKHAGPGVLSMANSGPGTNGRQFFVTYKSAPHLDRKHAVFGRVVKGLDVLRSLESIPTDKKDRPVQAIKIETAELLGSNPVTEAKEKERIRIERNAETKRKEAEMRKASALGRNVAAAPAPTAVAVPSATAEPASSVIGIGKYLPKGLLRSPDEQMVEAGSSENKEEKKKKKKKKKKKGDASATTMGAAATATIPSRLPPPPKKTTFGDFSGW